MKSLSFRWCHAAKRLGCLLILFLGMAAGQPSIFITEIHYHPVEEPAFNPDGSPVLDLSEDVHEFIELFNAGSNPVSLAGWELTGGISYDFPANAQIDAGQFLVVARNRTRLAAVYGLNEADLQGPYSGQLGNNNDTVQLRDSLAQVVDAVGYSAQFPWAISADALGVQDEFTGLRSTNYQYRGRSLERVSLNWAANDPANWLASPLVPGPSPGRTNAVTRSVPMPVVTSFGAKQDTDGATIIRSNQTVRIDCAFSATNQLSNVSLEYFVDDINLTNETRTSLLMSASEGTFFTAALPMQLDRRVVRYRFRANRGSGDEVVSPRADDPFAWHAYFVSPARISANPIYDCFISSASLSTLTANITQSPRRITLPDPPGYPRASWEADEPAIFVHDGVVYDIRMRHHGSRYNRNAARNSLKWRFPRYARFQDRTSTFITDKGEEHRAGHGLFTAAGLPTSKVRFVDLYLNANSALQRLEQEDPDEDVLARWRNEMEAANPGTDFDRDGEFYKSTGVIPGEVGEGPYGVGNMQLLNGVPSYWLPVQRYEWTYSIQMDSWKGHRAFQEMIEGLWAARGDVHSAPGPNVPAVRAFLQANFDIDATLTSIAIRNWMCPWDDVTHNYFLWRRANGRWSILPWDFDAEFGVNQPNTCSIFVDEVGDPSNTAIRGPNYLKDSIFKAFREEYRRKMFILNNTLLNPTNITALGFGTYRTFADARFVSVNQQLGLGIFHRPLRPTNTAPAHGTAALPPAEMQASAYFHSANPSPAHGATTWLIRHLDGSYAAPVFKSTSTNYLTSHPIPYDHLVFGEIYFWKCIYLDTNGHPSLDSAETSFVFGTPPVIQSLIAINATNLWRYNQGGTNPPADWAAPVFDDSSWPQGAALLADDTGGLPEPIRTTLSRGTKTSFYFRKSFVFNGDPTTAILRLREIIDDGVVVYLNGVEVHRRGTPSGAISYTTLANRIVPKAAYEGPFVISTANLVAGANVLAAEVHQNTASSLDVVFGLSLESFSPPSPGNIVLNEILAENDGAVTNGARGSPDYIELRNVSAQSQDLGGFSLSDDALRPGRYVFPPNTIIPPQGLLVVWCDSDTNAPGLHTGFGLDNDGQTVALFSTTPAGYVPADSVTFGLQAPGFSIGRDPSVAGPWHLNVPTPGTANAVQPLASPALLKINEWMATDPNGSDWFEIFNPATLPVELGGLYLTDNLANPTNSRIAPLSFLGPRDFRQFLADEDPLANARHVNFRLSGNGEAIGLFDGAGTVLEAITFGRQSSGLSEGRLPDGGTNIVSFVGSASPEAPNYLPVADVVINELTPGVELHNPGTSAVNIGGWWLSDDPMTLQKYRIPDGVLLNPGDYWSASAGDLNFSLDAIRGGRIILSHDDTHRTSARYGPFDGHSYGNVPTTLGPDFVRLSAATFGASNAAPEVGPIVISEIHYHPADLPGDDDNYEFIELANISGSPVNLFDPARPENRWRLRDAASFAFPLITLAAGERVLVLGFDPGTNSVALSNFVAAVDLPPGLRILGPFAGKLDNAGDSVELVKPGVPVTTPGPDFGDVPDILMDRVNYGDAWPWPFEADGSGASLQRSTLAGYGNEPTNWFASGVSPGNANTANLPPQVLLTAPANGAVFGYGLNLTISAFATDPDGSVRVVEFFANDAKIGESVGPNFSITWTNPPAGAHILTARARDNRMSVGLSSAAAINVVNQPPQVSINSPVHGAAYMLPTNILLSVAASDSDGTVVKVEFFDNATRLAELTASPYTFAWTNARSGTHVLTARATDDAGAVVTSAPITITAERNSYIAYQVQAGTIGGQDAGLGLGMDFDVLSPVLVTHLGVFDSSANGINSASTLTTQLYRRSGNTGTLLATLPFTSADPGSLVEGSRFKILSSPVVLSNGSYCIVSYGHSTGNPNGNIDRQPKTWNTDDGGGRLAFVGTSRFGSAGGVPGIFPATPDGGPMDRYAAATFEYRRLTATPTIFGHPTNQLVRPGSNAVFSVAAFGNAPLRYQWFFDGNPLADATNSSITISNVQLTSIGGYSVAVSNAHGGELSQTALLGLLVNPDIVQPPVSQRVTTGATVTLSVTVTNTATLPLGYRWRRNGTFIPDAFFVSSNRTAFYTITNAQPPLTNYAVAVTNIARVGGILSSSAFLTFVTDTDSDGLPDEWENLYQLDAGNAGDRDLDADDDGQLNWQEYIAGTDPTNALSFLKIDSLTLGPGALLTFGALSNKTYTLQVTPEMNSSAWQNLLNIVARPTNRIESIIDPTPPAANRVYRLMTPASP